MVIFVSARFVVFFFSAAFVSRFAFEICGCFILVAVLSGLFSTMLSQYLRRNSCPEYFYIFVEFLLQHLLASLPVNFVQALFQSLFFFGFLWNCTCKICVAIPVQFVRKGFVAF